MPRTRVKICGITRVEDALVAANSGADALGFVFYEASPRAVSVEQAAKIAKALPAFVSTVALFVNSDTGLINQVIKEIKPSLLQFHGDESPEECESYGHDFIKAVRVKSDTNLIQYALRYQNAKGLLLDAYAKGVPGGTGRIFDWELIPENLPLPVVLAGGLNANNVASAISQVKPYAVDVSGGVEASKGIKDLAKVNAFIQQVNHQ